MFLEKRMPEFTLSPLLRALRAGWRRDAESILAAVTRLDELLTAKR
jgi:hypothetical protein